MNTWDETKRLANLAKHGVDFAVAQGFDWETALTAVDDRRDYGEGRFISIGYVGLRLHVMVWTPRCALANHSSVSSGTSTPSQSS